MTSAQLTDKYSLPQYAEGMLSITSLGLSIPVTGEKGMFLPLPDRKIPLRLVWGAGPTLVFWKDHTPTKIGLTPDSDAEILNMRWDGRIRIGGYIERLHAFTHGGLDILIAMILGGPYEEYMGLPSLADYRNGVTGPTSSQQPISTDHFYPFIVEAESTYGALLQDALVARIAVDAGGMLAPDATKWHKVVGLPLVLDTLTLLAP